MKSKRDRFFKFICRAAAVLLVAVSTAAPALAFDTAESYTSYNYNAWNSITSAPAPYTLKSVYNGLQMGSGRLNEPEDLFYRAPYLYILDSGNDRIVVLDESFSCARIIDVFYLDGEELTLSNPNGFYIRGNGEMLICDTGNNRVLITDPDGNILNIMYKPSIGFFDINMDFQPLKILEDSIGSIYVLVKDFYYGALAYSPSGELETFFGANNIAPTWLVLYNLMWKRFMTERQLSYLPLVVPTSYSGFTIDGNDFIYTVTKETGDSSTWYSQIKKLNKQGNNILRPVTGYDYINRSVYGDKERMYIRGVFSQSVLEGIAVTDEGIITALDAKGGKVFQYTQESDLLFIFGGIGYQQGVFQRPSAIAAVGRDVVILDSAKGDLTVYEPTMFAGAVLNAYADYRKGRYEEAAEQWGEVLKLNSNYELAYSGVGKALLEQNRYDESLWYFKRGHDRENYSRAFNYVRAGFIKQYFAAFALIVVLLVAWLFVKKPAKAYYRVKTGRTERVKSEQTPVYVATHLLNGFEPIRRTDRFSLLACAFSINALWFFAAAFSRQNTGFIFNLNRPESLNLLLIFAQTFGVMLLFSICNRAVTSLTGGEGTFKRIYIVTAYSLFPYIVCSIISTILSNAAVYEEGALLGVVTGFGMLWSGYLLWNGIKEVHQYTAKKNLLCILLTLLGMMVVLFLIMLFIGLAQQLGNFLGTIYNEVMFRTV